MRPTSPADWISAGEQVVKMLRDRDEPGYRHRLIVGKHAERFAMYLRGRWDDVVIF